MAFIPAAAGVKPVTLDKASGNDFKSMGNARINVSDHSINLVSTGGAAGCETEGTWDLSGYKAMEFTVTNKSEVFPLMLFSSLCDPTCKDQNYSRAYSEGKAQYQTMIGPGETAKVVFNFPAPMPHPEINQTFIDNWIIGKQRNTPYSYGYGMCSYAVDLKNVTKIKIGATKIKPGVEFEVSGIKLVPGKQKDVPAWMKMGKDEFFPFIDKYGQFKYSTWTGKIKSDKDLQKARIAEEKDLQKYPAPQEWSKFGGWKNGPKYEATGHFYVKKIDGKWWMIDPEGYLFWSHGVVRVTPSCAVTPLDGHKFYFEGLPQNENDPMYHFYFTYDELLHPYYTARDIKETYDFSCANIARKYGENYREKWYELCHKRLRSWGVNTIANSSDHAICLMDKTVYNDRVDLGSAVEGYPEWPILEGSTGWWKFIDPFDDLFETCVRAHLEAQRQELDDPWCLGFFVDNEIRWGDEAYLASLTFKAPASQASKRVMINWLMSKYPKISDLNKAWKSDFKDWNALYENRDDAPKGALKDMKAFSPKMVEKYFSVVRSVFKSIAPQKLYMGCRFSSSPEFVVRIAAKYCDVMSYNQYNYSEAAFKFPEGIDLPMMIGEFHFGAMDRGMFHTGLVYCDSQEERGEAYQYYLESALRHPNIIGTNWHQFSDQPTTGRFDGENFQVGFTDVCDTPYAETVKHLRWIGENMYKIRSEAK